MTEDAVTSDSPRRAAPCRGRHVVFDGSAHDGEDLEVPFAEAPALIERGEIVDGRTIMLLPYARRERPAAPRQAEPR